MEDAARAGAAPAPAGRASARSSASAPPALAGDAGFATDFVGYETTDSETTIGAAETDNGRVLIKLVESPFYATGGGQVADSGYVECLHGDCRARVEDVLRLGDDQVLAVVPERGHDRGRRARARARRSRHPARDRVQPHRDSPAPRRAPPAARHPRPAGRLVRRPRQAALRLHARQGAQPRGARRHRGPGQPVDPREPARPRAHARRSRRRSDSARWRCSARSTATSCGWSRSATARSRASCAAAPTSATRPRSACSRC